MVWAFSTGNVNNVKNFFVNFCNAVFAYILNNAPKTANFPTFLGGLTQYRDTFAATGANILGLGAQKTRAPLSPGQSSSLKFPAKADLIP